MYSTGIDRFGLETSRLAVAGLTNKEPVNVEIKNAKIKVKAIAFFLILAIVDIFSLDSVKSVLVYVSELNLFF